MGAQILRLRERTQQRPPPPPGGGLCSLLLLLVCLLFIVIFMAPSPRFASNSVMQGWPENLFTQDFHGAAWFWPH